MSLRVPDVVASAAAACGAGGWLRDLPGLIAELETEWSVSVGCPFPHSSEAFVAEASLADGIPVTVTVCPHLAIAGVSAIEAGTARAIRHVRMRPWSPRLISSPSSALWPTSRLGVLIIQEYLGAQNCSSCTRETTEIEADKAMSEQVISRTEVSYEGIAIVTYGDGSQEIHYDVNNRGDAADQARAGYARRLAQRSGGILARESSLDGVAAS